MKIHGQELQADVAVTSDVLRDSGRVLEALRKGATALGATVLSEHVQHFEPTGMTAVVVIGESHLVASTYEEAEILAVGIQTCTAEMDLLHGLATICVELGSDHVKELMTMRRIDVPFRTVLQARDVALVNGRLQIAAVGG